MRVTQDITLGWIGTGVMGLSMCGHLVCKGYPVTVYSRTRSRSQPLLDQGAHWAENPRAVAERADIIFTMVGFPGDVREVYFGEHGILAGCAPGKIVVDMTTTEPGLAREIHVKAGEKGVLTLDAPVTGGDIGARNATLSIMVGGDSQVFEDVRPLLEVMGRNIVYQGGAGMGQHAKMCNQIVIASTMIGMCEGMLYAYKAGLDLETMLSSLRGGAADCWALNNLAPRILKRNFDPGFFVEHFIKDLGIALEEARRMGIRLPGLMLAHQLYLEVQSQGHGRKGTQALMLAMERVSGFGNSGVQRGQK